MRQNELDNFIGISFRNSLIRHAQKVFSDKALAEEVNNLTFEQTSKILSDLVHHGSVISIAQKVFHQLPDTSKGAAKKPQEPVAPATESDQSSLVTRNLNPMMRLLDAIGNNDF